MTRAFGKYVLLEKIAAGGMAEIYKAAYAGEGDFRKICAIKRVLPTLASDDEFIRMFREEAALTVRLSHANVVQVFDFGKAGDDWYLAMEYVRGPTLRGVLNRCQQRGEKIPVKLALYVALEMTKGLGHAHSRTGEDGASLGIVHRDVSPANVLVSWDGEVKITDFGIARMASRVSHTVEGMVRGKASYLSPEQASGGEVDARTDLYAVGITLWETIGGRKLFSGESPSELMANVMSAPIPPPSSVVPGLPAPLDALVAKMLEREADARFADAIAQERAITGLLAKMGGATAADLAAFVVERFPTELDEERTRSRQEYVAPVAAPASVPGSAWSEQDAQPRVERLSDEERRKLFDLPEPTSVSKVAAAAGADPAPRDHFLDLESAQIPGVASAPENVVARVRVGGMLVHVLRASAVAAGAMAVLVAALRLAYRY